MLVNAINRLCWYLVCFRFGRPETRDWCEKAARYFPELWTELLTNDSPSVWIKPGWRALNDVFLIGPKEEIELRRQALLGDSDAIRKLALYYSMFKDDVPSAGAWIDLDPELSRTNRVLRIHGNGLHEP